MKMTKKHYEMLEKAVKPLDTQERRDTYKKHGFTNMRYRWDLFWKSEIYKTFWMQEVYAYCNDDHIDTVLRNIVPTLGEDKSLSYEVWVKPYDGVLVVQERDISGRISWSDKQFAIDLAKANHSAHPNINFIVRECHGHHGPYVKVYDTYEDVEPGI